MEQHPIEGLMRTALENIRDMVDVSTVVGEPIDNGSGVFMVPICKVSCGFISGGSEFGAGKEGGSVGTDNKDTAKKAQNLPFGGGSGAGVGITPLGFLVIQGEQIRLITLDSTLNLVDRITDLTPKAFEKLRQVFNKKPGVENMGTPPGDIETVDLN